MSFPSRQKFLDLTMSVALAIPNVLSRIPNATREIPRRLKCTDQTVFNWLNGATQPSASNLVALMREFDEVADEVLRLAGRQRGGLTEVQKRKLREIIGDE